MDQLPPLDCRRCPELTQELERSLYALTDRVPSDDPAGSEPLAERTHQGLELLGPQLPGEQIDESGKGGRISAGEEFLGVRRDAVHRRRLADGGAPGDATLNDVLSLEVG